jgi:hypothetical protein
MTQVRSARVEPSAVTETTTEVAVKAAEMTIARPIESAPALPPKSEKFAAPRANVAGAGTQTLRFDVEAKLTDGKQNAPEVEALLAAYAGAGSKPVSRPQERFLQWVAYIDGKLKEGKSTGEVVDIAVKDDLRRRVFLLEGLTKLYRSDVSPEFDHIYDASKKLEDALGGYTYAQGLTKIATESGAPAAAVDYLKACEAKAREDLEAHVRKHWMPDEHGKIPSIKKMVSTVRKADLGKYKDDRQRILDKIRDEIKDMDETDFDMKDLEGGLHELRRQMRFISVFCESAAGLIQFDPNRNPSPDYAHYANAELASSKYLILPGPEREKNPVQLSKSLFTANMDYVLKLGALKDMGERLHGLTRALIESKSASSPEAAEKQAMALLKLDEKSADFTAQGAVIYDEVKERKFFKALRRDLKEQ